MGWKMSLWMLMNQVVASKFFVLVFFTCVTGYSVLSMGFHLFCPPHLLLSCCRYAAVLSTPARCLEDKLKVSWCASQISKPDVQSSYLFYSLTLSKPGVWPTFYRNYKKSSRSWWTKTNLRSTTNYDHVSQICVNLDY